MGRKKQPEFEFEPLVSQKSLPEKIVPFVSMGLLAFVVVGLTVYFAFGEGGVQIYLIFCGLLTVVGVIFLLIRGGADIALRATESSAKVFMQQDIVDAYTDNVRLGGGRRGWSSTNVLPEQTQTTALQPPAAIVGTPIELPKPGDSVLRF